MAVFKCSQCRKNSSFKNPKVSRILEAVIANTGLDKRTRTYECEHCGSSNEVTMTNAEWNRIGVLF